MDKLIKQCQIFLDVFGTLLGIALFVFAYVISHGTLLDSLGLSLGGVVLPIMVYASKHER